MFEWLSILAAREGAIFWILVVCCVFSGVVLTNVRGLFQIREREKTLREIAQLVADGEISADDAAKLIGPGEARDL